MAIVKTEHGEIRFSTTNELLWWRTDTFTQKEPETLSWINSMKVGDTLCDIGANIGLYSLFAAKRGIKVFAFEPEALNFAELCRNISLNQATQISPFNIALSDKQGLINFKMSNPYAGAANHKVEQVSTYSNKEELKQNVYGESLDNMITNYGLPCPNHIKIDVDGLEYEIVKGLKETLKNSSLKSVLIEIDENLANHKEIITRIESAGFKIRFKTDLSFKINNYIFERA